MAVHDRNQILAEKTVRAETKLAREANAARDKNAFMVIVRGNDCVSKATALDPRNLEIHSHGSI